MSSYLLPNFWECVEVFDEPFLKQLPSICDTNVIPLSIFVTVLSVLGVLVKSLLIHCVVADGRILSSRVLPLSEPPPGSFKHTTVRDLKLVFSGIGLVVYICLFIGVQLRSGMFLLPWMFTKAILMAITMVLTTFKFFLQTPMSLSALGLISLLIEVQNYLYVLCFYNKIANEG